MADQISSDIILIGGGGHAKVVIETVRAEAQFSIIGIIDNKLSIGTSLEGVPVIGSDEFLQELFRKGIQQAFIAVGSVQGSHIREEIFKRLKEIGFQFPSIIHSSARVASSVSFGEGVLVTAGSVIQPGAKIGNHAIINTSSSIDHDCIIGDFVHIAPGSVLSGGVHIGAGTHIGTGSVIIENIVIGERSFIGAGSVVIKNIPAHSKAFGNPCRVQTKL